LNCSGLSLYAECLAPGYMISLELGSLSAKVRMSSFATMLSSEPQMIVEGKLNWLYVCDSCFSSALAGAISTRPFTGNLVAKLSAMLPPMLAPTKTGGVWLPKMFSIALYVTVVFFSGSRVLGLQRFFRHRACRGRGRECVWCQAGKLCLYVARFQCCKIVRVKRLSEHRVHC